MILGPIDDMCMPGKSEFGVQSERLTAVFKTQNFTTEQR